MQVRKKWGGAGYQCGSSRVCPVIVPYPDFVQYMSSLCLELVLVSRLTSIWVPNQRFVLIKSSLCPRDPILVLFMSSNLAKIDRKVERQNLVKVWVLYFSRLSSSHTAGGQKVDNLRTRGNQQFGHLLSKERVSPEIYAYHSSGKSWTNTSYSNP